MFLIWGTIPDSSRNGQHKCSLVMKTFSYITCDEHNLWVLTWLPELGHSIHLENASLHLSRSQLTHMSSMCAYCWRSTGMKEQYGRTTGCQKRKTTGVSLNSRMRWRNTSLEHRAQPCRPVLQNWLECLLVLSWVECMFCRRITPSWWILHISLSSVFLEIN